MMDFLFRRFGSLRAHFSHTTGVKTENARLFVGQNRGLYYKSWSLESNAREQPAYCSTSRRL